MNILGFVNGVFSFIFNGTLWLGLVIGYILGRKFYKQIEDFIKTAINNIRKGGYNKNG